MKSPAARGWKGQSLLVNRHLTSPESKAHQIGLMPAFAHHALRIIQTAAQIAGKAKKRWRDGDPERLTIEDVRCLRQTMNDHFDALESVMAADPDTTMIIDQDAAARTYGAYGMAGITALALVEEAGELSEPLHAIATGSMTPDDARQAIHDEAADVRVWIHLVDNAFRIDTVSTTQDKWERSAKIMGEAAAQALAPRRLDKEEIAASMAALAKTVK